MAPPAINLLACMPPANPNLRALRPRKSDLDVHFRFSSAGFGEGDLLQSLDQAPAILFDRISLEEYISTRNGGVAQLVRA
ncbi:MAG: hypothetical protein P8X58_10505, partial [Syntrophobacterales bacterium]